VKKHNAKHRMKHHISNWCCPLSEFGGMCAGCESVLSEERLSRVVLMSRLEYRFYLWLGYSWPCIVRQKQTVYVRAMGADSEGVLDHAYTASK
jgi:hypothetical protein